MKIPADSPCAFDKTAGLASRFVWLAETGSTNDDAAALVRDAQQPAEEFTVVATDTQTAGRGRLGRVWKASSGKSLAVSVVLRPDRLWVAPNALAWIPLVAGLAMVDAIQHELAASEADTAPEGERRTPLATLKWPNDVLIDGFKVSGILTELLGEERAVVVGSGVNLTLDEHDLPTITSTSLQLASGHAPDPDRLLSTYLDGLRQRIERLSDSGGDPITSGLMAELRARCSSIGAAVRVEFPDGRMLDGAVEDVDLDGRVLVRDLRGDLHAIAAGDITHLKLES